MRSRIVGLIAALALMSGSAFGADPYGDWMVEDGTGVIRIGPCATVQIDPAGDPVTSQPDPNNKLDPEAPLCGLLAWSKIPAKGDPDYDPGFEGKTLIGTKILANMKPKGENRWEGDVINPKNGKVYQSFMTLKSADVLHIQGCVLGFLCGSQEWTRHTDAAR